MFSAHRMPAGRTKLTLWARVPAVAVAAALLAGCSSMSGALFPDAPDAPAAVSVPDSFVQAPQTGTGQFVPATVAPAVPSPSPAGQAASDTRNALLSLQGQLAGQNVTLSAIRQALTVETAKYREARIAWQRAAGVSSSQTAPGNASAALERMRQSAQGYNGVIAAFAEGNARSNALMSQLDKAAPFSEEDRRQINALRGALAETATSLDLLVTALAGESASVSAFVAKERATLAALGAPAPGHIAPGQSAPASVTPLAPAAGTAAFSLNRPALVTIKFDRPNVVYRPALAVALERAQQKRQDLALDVVGVSPDTGPDAQSAARALAQDVTQALLELGVPAGQIAFGTATQSGIAAGEVRIFSR